MHASIWNIFLNIFGKSFLSKECRENLTFRQFCTNLSFFVNISVISSSIQVYLAVKGEKDHGVAS